MKVAISIPDPIFAEAEKLAARERKSRSQFYAEAIALYVDANRAEAVTERLNAVYSDRPAGLEPILQKTQIDMLRDAAW
jgi:metal-responsive CopG/Arc/MetJ family transcriptional regulator